MFKNKPSFIALLSDVHSNLEALEAVLEDIDRRGISCIGFLGDAVGYGPDPLPCLELLKHSCNFIVAGNHDRAVARGEGLAEMSHDARETAAWTAGQLHIGHRHFLDNLPLAERNGTCLFTHGSPLSPEMFDYVLTVAQSKKVFLEYPCTLFFIGHSHMPAAFIEIEFRRMFAGHVHRVAEKQELMKLPLDPAKRYLINIGSVGQPRDGDPRAAYGVLNLEHRSFELRRVSYDIEQVVRKMKNAGFSTNLTERIIRGV